MRRTLYSIIVHVFLGTMLCSVARAAPVAFCGVVSRDAEGSMVKMTEDLYYTQLLSISGVEVVDRRGSGFAHAYLEGGVPDFSLVTEGSVFYALINREGEDEWHLSLCLASPASGAMRRVDKTYDSYYKILMENKGALLTSFKTLLSGGGHQGTEDSDQGAEDRGQGGAQGTEASQGAGTGGASTRAVNTDSLAGTWMGEDGMEKAVILRGGRGFVIFEGGATMNIKVAVDADSVVITQAGRSNASFFPELPRQVALNLAGTAEPIVWKLSFDSDGALTGEKRTLIANGKGAQMGRVAVKWRRK